LFFKIFSHIGEDAKGEIIFTSGLDGILRDLDVKPRLKRILYAS